MSNTNTPLLSSALFLAATTGFLYCASTAYSGGYLSSLNLDPNILDQNFHQVLYDGVKLSIFWVLIVLNSYWLLRIVYSQLILPLCTDDSEVFTNNRPHYIKSREFLINMRSEITEKLKNKRNVDAFSYAALSVVFLFSMGYFELQGKSRAATVLEQIETTKPHEVANLIRVKIDGEYKNLFYLRCGARNCAGIDLASRTIHYFQQTGHSFQYLPLTSASPAPSAAASSAQ
jgi:hypothetical protein